MFLPIFFVVPEIELSWVGDDSGLNHDSRLYNIDILIIIYIYINALGCKEAAPSLWYCYALAK